VGEFFKQALIKPHAFDPIFETALSDEDSQCLGLSVARRKCVRFDLHVRETPAPRPRTSGSTLKSSSIAGVRQSLEFTMLFEGCRPQILALPIQRGPVQGAVFGWSERAGQYSPWYSRRHQAPSWPRCLGVVK